VVHGIDVEGVQAARRHRDEVRQELGIADDQVVVCTVANLRWQKGYPDLLTAARRVVDRAPEALFLAVGQGPLAEEITARRDELGLQVNFRLLGYRPDAVRILAASDVFALASLHEGYPIAVMEALAVGLPVVATDAGGVPEAVRQNVEGFVLPAGHPEALADALVTVVTDAGLRARMSAAAAERGRQYDLATAIERLEQIYREVAHGRSSVARDRGASPTG
jgi:glycosyltransferase involved in cell wall biosynthesis